MPKLPGTDFTATPVTPGAGIRGTRGVRTGGARAFGGGIGSELAAGGEMAAAVGARMLDAQEANEKRRVQLATLKLNQAFRAEMDRAAVEGGDFEAIQDRYQEQMIGVRDGLETTAGLDVYTEAAVRISDRWGATTRAAKAKQLAVEARNQVDETQKLWGNEVLQNADSLPLAQEQMAEMVATFGLNPDQEAAFKLENDRTMAKAAADGLLLRTPGELLQILSEGEGLPGLTASDTAQYIARAQAAVQANVAKAESLSWEQKFQRDKAMAAREDQGRVPDAERFFWEAEGATPAGFMAMQERAEAKALAREELHQIMTFANAGLIGAADVPPEKQQAAFDAIVAASVEGLTPEEQAARALETRVRLSAENGIKDSKMASAMNAGAVGNEDAFGVGKAYRDAMKEEAPDLLPRMLNQDSAMMYDLHDAMTKDLGIAPQAAYQQLSEARANTKQVKAVMDDKDLKERLMGHAADLAVASGIFTDTPMMRQQVADRAQMYMALVPQLNPEHAVDMAAKAVEERTEVIGSSAFFGGPGKFRVPVEATPADHAPADRYIRSTVLPALFTEQGLSVPDDLNRYVIRPTGDGVTADLLHPDTGMPVFVRWDWKGGIDQWRREVHAKNVRRRDAIRAWQVEQRVSGQDDRSLLERLGIYSAGRAQELAGQLTPPADVRNP